MDPEKPDTTGQENEDSPSANIDLENFFSKMPSNLRWPKPDQEAVAAAVEAIQRISAVAPTEAADGDSPEPESSPATACPGCGQPLGENLRFCGHCGAPSPTAAAEPAGSTAQQHIHHHYHHFVPAQGAPAIWPGADASSGQPARPATAATAATSATVKSAPGSRAELAAKQLVRDWMQACNTRHLDDLVELYSPDATVIRSNIPPVRSLASVRELLHSQMEAGLGDVEMDSLRTEVYGDIAIDLGRCKMLVPVAMGKRREERGKYVLVLNRLPSGTWKILVDIWASDLPVANAGAVESGRKPEKINFPSRPR